MLPSPCSNICIASDLIKFCSCSYYEHGFLEIRSFTRYKTCIKTDRRSPIKSRKTHITQKTNRQYRSSSIVFWWPPASIALDRMDVVPAEVLPDEGAQPPPRKRSRLEWRPLEENVFRCKNETTEPRQKLQEAVQDYLQGHPDLKLKFRSPTYTAAGWSQVGRCMKCEDCPRHYKFSQRTGPEGDVTAAWFCYSVAVSGECRNRPRILRPHVLQPAGQPSEQDRMDVWAAANSLVAEGLHATPSNVAVRLGPKRINARALSRLLQSRKRKHGKSTAEFASSVNEFVAWARDRADPNQGCIAVCRYELEPTFYWVCLVPPMLDLVQALLQRDGPESSFLLGKLFIVLSQM